MKQRGGAHIPIEVIWSNVQTRVGTPHKVLEKVEEPGVWVGRLFSQCVRWVGGRLSNVILDPTLAQLGFRIQVRAECGNKGDFVIFSQPLPAG